jgi:hypothetical protein
LGPEVEVYYMRSRWYGPKVGRFWSEDPLGLAAGLNLYAYAGNDPVNGSDPLGLCEWAGGSRSHADWEAVVVYGFIPVWSEYEPFRRRHSALADGGIGWDRTFSWGGRLKAGSLGSEPVSGPSDLKAASACSGAVLNAAFSATSDVLFFTGLALAARAAQMSALAARGGTKAAVRASLELERRQLAFVSRGGRTGAMARGPGVTGVGYGMGAIVGYVERGPEPLDFLGALEAFGGLLPVIGTGIGAWECLQCV